MASSVHRGVAFEHRSLQLLQAHLSMALRRVGGKSDGGIDLVGWWWLPFTTDSDATRRPGALPDTDGLLRRRLRVLAQCKAEKKKFSPKYVREMEGVWHIHSRSSNESDTYPTVALLLSESPFSRSTALHVYRSTVPFLLMHLPNSQSNTTLVSAIGTVCPNPTLTRLVKPLAFHWERHSAASQPTETDRSTSGRPGLWWQGHKLGSWVPDLPDLDTT
ncbi:hypothetical protein JVU11DRAFT_7813 [Chiua virens]|nr:hypothetical protein JVU11DRAFT_7813 [Chiua virens]